MNHEALKYIAAAVAFAGGGVLAYANNDAYGWFLFAGIMVAL